MANLAPFCPNGAVQVSSIVDCDGKNDWITREVIHAAWCWKLTLTDGTVLGFTSHDQDIKYSSVTYEAATGFIPSAVATSNDMAVDTVEVQGYIKSDRISDADLISGRFDMAKIDVFIVNWANLTDKIVYVRRGTIGEIKYGQISFTADLRGMLDVYQAKAGMIYQKLCRAKFGDTKCKADVAPYTATGTVTELYGDGNIETDLTQATMFFNYGVLKWLSGKNINLKTEVKYYTLTTSGGIVQPFISPVWPPAVGDTFTVTAGCDANFSTCKTRGNYLNFRGEPYVPGNDYSTSYPTKGSGNTSASGTSTYNASYGLMACTGGDNTYSYTDTAGTIQYTNQNCTVVTMQILASLVTDSTKLAYKIWAPWAYYSSGGDYQYTMGLNNAYVGTSDALAPVNEGATESETTSTWQHSVTTGAWTKVQVNGVDYWQAPARTLLTAQPVGGTFQICCKMGAGADAANITEINGGCPTQCDCARPLGNSGN